MGRTAAVVDLVPRVGFIAGYAAIASALPYLALKIVWLGGGSLGVADRAIMHESTMVALNATTAGMDLVGITLALAFTHRWGLRIPAWLLLPPMWVASGLLARFMIGVPIVGLLSAFAPGSLPTITSGPVEGWVYVLVYIEFAGLGAGLMLAFVLYAKRRWPEVFQPTTDAVQPAPPHRVNRALSNTTAPVAIALGMLHLAWAVGATVGLSESAATRRTTIGSAINGIDAVLMMAAAVGVLMMVHRIGKPASAWLPLSMAWVGTASLFAWGLWQTINVLGQTALLRGVEGRAFVNLVGLARLIVGLTMGLLFLQLVAEREQSAARRHSCAAATGVPDRCP